MTISDNESPLSKKNKMCPILKTVNGLQEKVLQRKVTASLYICLNEASSVTSAYQWQIHQQALLHALGVLLDARLVLEDVIKMTIIVLCVE